MITLVSEGQAKLGFKFKFLGLPEGCKKCRFHNLCSRLRKGMIYIINEVRGIKHECKIFGKVMVVKVRPLPLKMLIPSNASIRGIRLRYARSCNNSECKYYELCNPICLREGDQVRVVAVSEDLIVECGGRRLVIAEVEIL